MEFLHKKLKLKRGFTLIEMLIYAVILATVSVLAVKSTFSMVNAFAEIRVSRDVNSAATTALERVVREVRKAESVDLGQSTLGSHPGRLTLNTTDSLGAATTVEFYIENGLLKIKEGGVAKGQLIPSSAQVTNLIFNNISTTASEAMRTTMQVSAQRGNAQNERVFYTTTILRGSY